jgi:FlaA1/EpsC-like NDP-sugar epimerase
MPISKLGKWSVGLNTVFLVVIAVALVFVLVLKTLSFDDRWWDITVPIAFLIAMATFFTGIRAVRKYQDHSALVYLSIITGVCVLLFVFTHSLYIKD